MDIHDWILAGEVVLGVVFGGGVIAFFKLKSDNRKTNAEANKLDADTIQVQSKNWVDLVQNMSIRLAVLTQRVEELEKDKDERDKIIDDLTIENNGLRAENSNLKRKVADLEARVIELEKANK